MGSSPAETDDDTRIGVPMRRPGGAAAPAPAPRLPEPEDANDSELRPGETELGRPPQVPGTLTPLSDQDRKRLADAEQEQARRELAEVEEMLASEPALFRGLGVFAHPLASALLIGMVGVLGLFVYSQVINVLNSLNNQPEWARSIGYAGLALLASCVVFAMLRLMLLYLRLKRNQQLRLGSLQELSRRSRLRWLAEAKSVEAKRLLEDYLRAYPLQTPRERRTLDRVGMSDTTILELERCRVALLDPGRFASSEQWFEEFRNGFQKQLDQAADARVKYWAKRTGIITAMAPNALIDSVASTYFGFAMITDLCTVYNLRVGRAGTMILLTRVFFNAYLAGQMTEWEKLTEEQINQMFHPGGPLYELAAARMVSKVGTKAAGGVLSYFLVNRLGRYACRLLRPVVTH